MNTSNSESAMTAPGNPGERLRQAREARHWSRAEVALQLHLAEDAVRHIEEGLFDKLPGTTFSRGYIRSYAKLLGLDHDQLAHEFDLFIGAQPPAPMKPVNRIHEPARMSQNVLRGGLFVLSLVAVGIGVLWWQERYGEAPARTTAPIERVEVDTADGSTEVLTLDEPEDQAVQAAQVPIDLLEPAPAPPEGVPGEARAGAESATPATATAEPAAPVVSQPEIAPGEGRVQISFIADCWVQITDATGKVHVAELKRQGDSIDLTAPAPLQVRLGFVQGAQVSYNGEPIDLSGRRTQTANLRLGE